MPIVRLERLSGVSASNSHCGGETPPHDRPSVDSAVIEPNLWNNQYFTREFAAIMGIADFLLRTMQALSWYEVFEITGVVTGLLAVWLLIRQNTWTWPVGFAYALVSVVVFLDAELYPDVVLHFFYVGMNLYGWWYWLFGGRRKENEDLPVTTTPGRQGLLLLGLSILGILAMGFAFSSWTDADFVYWNSVIAVLSFTAMWMMARKYLENWIIWFLVDVNAVILYLVKGLNLYALLYGVYLAMAVAGWMSWRRTMQTHL